MTDIPKKRSLKRATFLLISGILLILGAHAWGLTAPLNEVQMGITGRILYVHVPTAWVALLVFCIAFGAAIRVLWAGSKRADYIEEASLEVGVVLTIMLLVQGSIWGRATWETWWTWDPRLTSSAVMAISFAGILVLRGMLHDPDKRRTISAVSTIIAFMNVPVVYFSVKLLPSIHQLQSTPNTVDSEMHWPLRTAAFGFLFLSLGLIGLRARVAELRAIRTEEEPDLPPVPETLQVEV